ncbi:MAG TPA: acyl-CoA synthetase [Micromonosporaceae bacterium]|nr:acyl-CoA synthetase [Micromonosporaceae bacterium]HCU52227.1 acyl-CoA synthetase [Micromonosporaceae bacterium]
MNGGLIDVFTQIAKRFPDHPAVAHNGSALSYIEVDAKVQAMAERLGPRPGVVGVRTSRTPTTVIEMFGVWAAGGTYCPIDPTYPEERQRAMRAAAGCGKPATSASEDHAYILFTSGSTGEPKPVVTPQTAIAATVRSLRDLFGLSAADRVLQFASLNWDTCFEEILPTLTTGATLVFDDEAYTGSFPRFLRMVERQRITLLDLPTAFWHELVLHLAQERAGLPECLRVMVIGGEAVNPARLADWRALDTGGIRLVNTYGCTETTLITHAVDLHGPQAKPGAADGKVPIGWALPHVIEHVSNDDELLIGGPAVALGYKGLPEATEARFVAVDGIRYFRTGDRVSRAGDGALVPEGRLDHEVKIRGIRVDPAEVEALIAAHPGVSAVAAMGVPLAGRTALVAYVVVRPGDEERVSEGALREYLRTRVPEHLVPSRINVVPQLIYTTSGKIDRAKSREFFDER